MGEAKREAWNWVDGAIAVGIFAVGMMAGASGWLWLRLVRMAVCP